MSNFESIENKIKEEVSKNKNTISRLKNPYFWISIGAVILTTLQVEATSLTSWASVGKLLVDTISNPYLVVTTIISIIGIINNPTTKGLSD